MSKVGFIGTGVMGKAIIDHLLREKMEVCIYNRTKTKADDLVSKGAIWCNTPAEIAQCADIIFTMVGFPTDVENVYFGDQGIFTEDIAGKTLIDLTTSTPYLAEKISKKADELSAHALDAPVSGGDLGAKKGILTIMVGGDLAVYHQILPIFKIFGQTVTYHGTAGKGQHAKLANQIMIAGTMTGMTEMLVYAEKAGLDLNKAIQTVSAGSAANWSLTNYAPRILAENYSPGFFVKHFVKDLKIALDEADRMNLSLPATKLASELYEKLAALGFENDGTQALIKLWWSNNA